MAPNVFVLRKLGEGPGQLLLGQVEGVVVDFLTSVVEGLENMCNFPQVSQPSQSKLAKQRF